MLVTAPERAPLEPRGSRNCLQLPHSPRPVPAHTQAAPLQARLRSRGGSAAGPQAARQAEPRPEATGDSGAWPGLVSLALEATTRALSGSGQRDRSCLVSGRAAPWLSSGAPGPAVHDSFRSRVWTKPTFSLGTRKISPHLTTGREKTKPLPAWDCRYVLSLLPLSSGARANTPHTAA